MKYYIFFIFIAASTHSIAMDLPETKRLSANHIAQQKNERIACINVAINKAIQNSSLCGGLFTKSFLARDHFDLLKYVNSCYQKEMDEDDIDKLKKKNAFFATTIDYFSDIAKKNYDTVTLSTLNTITDYRQPQPTPELNKLSSTWKKYAMDMAYNKIRRVHSVEFIGHTAPVRRVAINPEKSLACSASKDGTFRLWNLETGKELCILEEIAISGYVTFNNEGTLLATATLSQEEPFEITIKVWNTDSKKIIWNVKHHNRFSALTFFQGTTDTTLAILGQNSSTLYALKEHQEPICIGKNIQSIPITVDKGHKIKKKDNHAWVAKKRAPRLYLCERAIENTTVPTLFDMQRVHLYQDLLESEKQIVDTLFKTKFLDTYTPIN